MFKQKKPANYGELFRPPDTVPTTRRRKRPRIMIDIAKLAVLVGGVWLFVNLIGLPAILWEYQYTGPKDHRQDHACTYIRIDGTVHKSVPSANAERCSLIAFFKKR